MAVKKSAIYSSLWKSCDELRGGMDASQYKDYVLVLLFVKYVSDKYYGKDGALIEVPDGGSFADMVKLKGDKDIGEKIDVIIRKLAEANDLKGVIDVAAFNDPEKMGSGKDMVDRLSNLIAIFDRPELNFQGNRAADDDILGDAYEYLMRHFATESGKSKGQFYTPSEVSRIMARVIGIGAAKSANDTIYDPTCGSGSLLLKAHDEAPADLTIYGQENDGATRALAKMNMILHDCPTAEIWRGNTLSAPHWKGTDGKLKRFDYVVANPPFSMKNWSNGIVPADDEFDRFAYGVPPAKNGDYAFLLHILASMKSKAKGAVILPHGVLFRGNAESTIRREVVRRGHIKGIIGLPANLFYGTGIPACIVVLDKEGADTRKGIFMIDASKGFVKDGNKNRLREQDIHRIVDTFTRLDETNPKYARLVPVEEIESHGYNLNIPRYIDASEPEDRQDIEGHLKGGIPERDVDALAKFWEIMPSVREALFAPDRPGYVTPKVEPDEMRAAIEAHDEFLAYRTRVAKLFAEWRAATQPKLEAFEAGHLPKALIHEVSEDLLARFAAADLIDKYDVYQLLMSYWAEVMQDDAYIISGEGWKAGNVLRELVKDKDGKFMEEPDITLGTGKKAIKLKAELIPPALIVARYFEDEQTKIDAANEKADALQAEIDELDEEHGQEDGLLSDAKTDKGKLTQKSVKDRIKEIKGEPDSDDERDMLNKALDLIERQAVATKDAKALQKALDEAVVNHYPTLSIDEIKSLVVGAKWLARIEGDVMGELDRVSQQLTARVKTLAARYRTPLADLETKIEGLSVKVAKHLAAMGYAA